MNFVHRCDILRRDIISQMGGAPTYDTVTALADVACVFTVLTAKQVEEGWAASEQVLTVTHASLRLALTLPDLPEPSHNLPDYTFSITWPEVGFIKPGLGVWTIEGKRFGGTHMEYLIKQ